MAVREEGFPQVVEQGRIDPAIPALLGASTIWGASFVITKIALPFMGPFTILLGRFLLALAVLAPFAWRRGFRPRDAVRKQFVLFGLTGMVLHLGLEAMGLKYTSASTAVLIVALIPALTAGLSVVMLREKLGPRRVFGIVLSVIGVIFVTQGQPNGNYPLAWLGNLLVFGGVATWALFTVQGKKMSLNEPWLVSTTAATAAAILFLVPLAAGEIALQGPPEFTSGSVASVLYLGLLASAAAYALWNFALDHVDASVAGPYVNLVPVIGVAIALLVGERMTGLQFAGGAVVIAGVWLSHRSG